MNAVRLYPQRESGFLAAKGNDRMKDLLAIVYKGLTRDGECKITIGTWLLDPVL